MGSNSYVQILTSVVIGAGGAGGSGKLWLDFCGDVFFCNIKNSYILHRKMKPTKESNSNLLLELK